MSNWISVIRTRYTNYPLSNLMAFLPIRLPSYIDRIDRQGLYYHIQWFNLVASQEDVV